MNDSAPVAICIPARDERAELPGLFDALAAIDRAGRTVSVCLFLDGCDDGSTRWLDAVCGDLPFALSVAQGRRAPTANAGRARRAALAMAEALAPPAAMLLSTDADSRPRPDWLRAAVAALAQADVAVGRVARIAADGDPVQTRVERYFDRLHAYRRRIDPVPWDGPGCHHGSAANMAIGAATYAALGGFPPVASGEDAGLLDSAARAGFRVRRDPAMVVETSSRRTGRAPGGLARALSELARTGAPQVATPAAAAWQYRRHAQARLAFAGIDDHATRAAFGRTIGLTCSHVLGVARDCANAEAFAMCIVPAGPGHERTIPLAEAERILASLERQAA